jgi:hypothetical protein
MTQKDTSFPSRKEFILGLSSVALFGCNSADSVSTKGPVKTGKVGERVSVGAVTYNVLEAEYKTQLGTATAPKLPEKRFLILRLAITNGGAKDVDLPMFTLVDEKGEAFQEVQDGAGVNGWLGMLRKIGPTSTEEGRVVFDVMPKDYKLEVSDGGEMGKELLAHIEIPMQFDTAEPIPAAGQGVLPPGAPGTK